MPTYICAAASDSLSADQKSRIAKAITRAHAEVTGAPAYFAQVIFNSVDAQGWYMGGAPLRHGHIFIHGHIRDGRSAREKSTLMRCIADEVAEICALPPRGVWVYLSEIPARQMIEFGHFLPQAGDEDAWSASLPQADREWMQDIGE